MSDRGPRLQALWATAERVAQIGSWERVGSGSELLWSDNLFRIFGSEPGEVEPTIEYVLTLCHPDDRQRLTNAIREFQEGGELQSVEYRITRPDGGRRHLRATVAVTERRGDRPHRLIGVVQDLTDSRHAEREIAAHVAVEEALVEWEGLAPGAHRLLVRLAAALDCVAGVFWVPRGEVLVALVFWDGAVVESGPVAAERRVRPLLRGSGLPGRAWEACKPLGWTMSEPAGAGSHDVAPYEGGLSGAVAIPALHREEVLAIVELKSDREVRIGERLMRSLFGISHELGHFLSRRGGELAAPLLTPREVEVLQLGAEGLTARMMAERLTVSAATIRTHLENIYLKLQVSDRSSAVATALRLGIID